MGSCTSDSKPIKCRAIAVSRISSSVKLNSNKNSGIHECFQFIRVLGHGQYGTVREAVRKSQPSSQHFAIKSIKKQKISKHRQILKRELEILTIVDHPNIIKLYETYEDELYLHLVMELCTGGDIFERLIKKGSFSELEAAVIIRKLMGAVNYLHFNGIIHRDLKPENFLYEKEFTNEIKICDFGMSIMNDGKQKMKTIVGTPYYVAPEVLRGPYTKACEIWSLGVFMYLILLGKHPFKGKNLHSIQEKASNVPTIIKFEEINSISDKAKDLLMKMLVAKPSKRITLKEALNHPWFENFDQKEDKISPTVLMSLCKYKAKNKL